MSAARTQPQLFDDAQGAIIAGLSSIPDYIDAEQEAALLHIIDQQPWLTDLKRRVQHYGYKYDYKARNITQDLKLDPIPKWIAGLCSQLHDQQIFEHVPDQVIINEYQPGQGITPHIDCVPCFGNKIASLSLGSTCVMDFTHAETGERQHQLLEPRSLIVLSGPARYEWRHAIPQRKTDSWGQDKITRGRRISLTFRTVNLQEYA